MSNTRVFIGRLSSRASERDIEHFFRGYGRIRDIVLKNGFGFVEFDDTRDADDAVYDLNGKELAGERVLLEFSRRGPRSGGGGYGGGGGYDRGGYGDRYNQPRHNSRYGPPTQTRHRLIVENLSTRCSWQDLKDMMRGAGEVTYADAHKGRVNEGVVCFARRDDLDRAIDKYQGKEINGRKIKLIDDSKERSKSRSRSRSKRRSRSRSSRSKSASRSRSRSRSRSGSPAAKKAKRSASRSKSRSKSRSRSPSANGNDEAANGSPAQNGSPHSRSGSPNE